MSVEKLLASSKAFEGRRVNLRVDTIETPSGRETTREIVEFPNCVAIVAIDANENAILVRQYRTAVGMVLLEIPAGKIEDDEQPLQAAHRELREETGYTALSMEELGGFYAGPGYSTEYLHLYLATNLEPTDETPDIDEIMNVFSVPLADITALIAKGDICDAKSVAGFLRVLTERGFGRDSKA
ncbi:MAG: NUDIX hydrolase [Chloroflexota bacterium]|nr:NUDIX hydrolase [Chloroflexota bacterium]